VWIEVTAKLLHSHYRRHSDGRSVEWLYGSKPVRPEVVTHVAGTFCNEAVKKPH
jgi:hypothetical protein